MGKLNGKKTYIIAILIGIVAVVENLGFISPEVALTLYGILGSGGLATLRHGVQRNK